jgi:hypothetical protein
VKTIVYVDGFNLYYGAVRATPYKWLNIDALVRNLVKGANIQRIRYFTALVQARPGDPSQPERQQAYLRALQTIPHLTIHYGRFLSSEVIMRLVSPLADGTSYVKVSKTEEKGSDVNLASYLLVDGMRDEYEQAIIVSNDSDLLVPVRLVKQELGLRVGVLCPHLRPSQPLVREATFFRPIRQGVLRASQFPPVLIDRHGKEIHKPSTW